MYDGLVYYAETLAGWLQVLQNFWNILNTPIYQFIQSIPVLDAALAILNTPAWLLIHNTGLGDMTFLAFILGTGLFVYVGYQFLIWVLNLVT